MNVLSPQAQKSNRNIWVDTPMMWLFCGLCIVGLLMTASASMEFADRRYGDALYFLQRQFLFILLASLLACAVYFRPSDFWFRNSFLILAVCLLLLAIVLIPDIGKEVNGSRRWLDLKVLTVQPSEGAKLAVIIFLADYIARRRTEICKTFNGHFKPLVLVMVPASLILLEPDYGMAVIIVLIAFVMLFLAGAQLWQSLMLMVVGGGLAALMMLAVPYRLERVKIFLDPWSAQFESGYQLVQSLIAIGSGGWFGQGLGGGMQKLFYLPEAHTDFIFSVLAEELGFVGVCFIIAAYFGILWRCFNVAARAERQGLCAGAFFAYGVGIWIGAQAFMNIAVVMGLLPTKGMTLPFISVGGSSLMAVFIAVAIVQRIHHETCCENTLLMRRYRMRRNGVS